MKVILSILLICSNLIVNGQTNDSIKAYPQDLIGMIMPEITETSISGNHWNSSTLNGKVIVLNFWFMGCVPCMKEIKYLNYLNKKYKNDNFTLLSIAPHVEQDLIEFNSDMNTMYPALRKYLANDKIEYEIIAECSERTQTKGNSIGPDCNRISSLFNVSGYPTTIIISQEGIIEYAKTGYVVNLTKLEEDTEYTPEFEKVINKLLKNQEFDTK